MNKPWDKKDVIVIDAPIANEVNYDKVSLEELQELGLN